MAAGKRVDNKGRVLKTGESQRKQDGRYQYRYMDCLGKRQYVYSMKLLPTDTVNGRGSGTNINNLDYTKLYTILIQKDKTRQTEKRLI